ncbi:MAG: hypothetical protein HQL67_01140 [Magnetococcales bacterium]|nr:hypothetical protein [Magnetococcales bacterium]
MFFKFFLPILVISIVYFVGKNHARKEQGRLGSASSAAVKADASPPTMQLIAISVVIAVFGLAAWYIYDDWIQGQIQVRIRVINAETGQVALYDAPKGLVHGRSFTTADGRRVTLADVERMEVQPVE